MTSEIGCLQGWRSSYEAQNSHMDGQEMQTWIGNMYNYVLRLDTLYNLSVNCIKSLHKWRLYICIIDNSKDNHGKFS